MNRPRLLDLFCKAGGAAEGYQLAGFDVTGVDREFQPRYRGARFIQADIFDLSPGFIASFDAVHASPICQGYSVLRHAPNGREHPQLIGPVRQILQASGRPYVIENVSAARWDMIDPITLCGSMFGLVCEHGGQSYQLQRHREFECSFEVPRPACVHRQPTIGVYGCHVRNRARATGGRGSRDFIGADKKALAMTAMGIGWPMTMHELSEAIPPAFTHHIGQALAVHLAERALAA